MCHIMASRIDFYYTPCIKRISSTMPKSSSSYCKVQIPKCHVKGKSKVPCA